MEGASSGRPFFWYSPLLRIEVILQPTHHKRKLEIEFYAEYFRNADCYGGLDRMFEVAETGGR
jgi:hypothetical protein